MTPKSTLAPFPLLLAIAILCGPTIGSSQQEPEQAQREKTEFSDLSDEQKQALITQRIEKLVINYQNEMGDQAPTSEQLPDFVKAIALAQIEQAKLLLKIRELEQNGRKQSKDKRKLAIMKQREEIDDEQIASLKEVLSKSQIKAFKKAKEKIQLKPTKGPGGRGQYRGNDGIGPARGGKS